MTKKFAAVLVFLFLLASHRAGAVTVLDFRTVDILTYRCYTEEKWDSVILVGRQALRQNIDYYYLRVRLGISYYQLKEYFPAATHLRKARQFNSGDPYVANYLYYSYLYTNRQNEAEALKRSMPGAVTVTDTSASKPGFMEEVHFETGYTVSSDRAPANLSTLTGKDSIYGEQDLYGNNFYGNLGLKFRVSRRLEFALAYNYLNFAKTKYIQYGRAEARLQSVSDSSWGRIYNYTFPWVIHDTSINYNIKQNEAYLAATISLPWDIKIIPAVHWINDRYSLISTTYTRKDTSYNNFVAALNISKDLGRFTVALNGSWSDLNGKTQIQAGASLVYYPLGNLNFYGATTVTGFFQGKTKRLLLGQVLGAKFTTWLWGEANFYYGDFTNANIFNAAIVYNNSDKMDYRAGANLVFVLGRHIQLSLIYQYFRKESQQIYYIRTQGPDPTQVREIQQIKYNPYNTNSIIGGVTWKF